METTNFEDDPWMVPQDHEDLQGTLTDVELPNGCSYTAIIVCVLIVIVAIVYIALRD